MNIFNPMLSDDDELFGSDEDELDSLPDFDEEDLEKFIESSDSAEKRDLVPGSIDDSYPVNYDDYVQQDIERGVREPEDADRTYEESFRSVLENAGYEPDDFSSGSSVDVVDDDTVNEGVSSVGEVFDEEIEEYSPSTSLEELLALQEAAEEDDESVDGASDDDGGGDDYPLSGSMFYISDDDDEDGANSHQLDIDAIITKAIDMGASDIDVIPNDEVTFTILGEVMRIPQFGVITNRQVANSYRDITSSQAQDDFLRFPEMDTSYEVRRGKHQGRRLRLSVGKTFDNHFMVFRVISNHIPSPQEIGMDARLLRWSTLPNGLVMINGKTGAGKALHVDTDIPTPLGMRKVKGIKIGDELFDENGRTTKVIDIHNSEDTKHYAVKFRNGEVVKAAGNHLWEVECLNDRVIRGPWVRELLTLSDFQKAVSMVSELSESSEIVLMGSKDISQIFANSSAELIQRCLIKNVKQIIPQSVPEYDMGFLLSEIEKKTIYKKEDVINILSEHSVLAAGGKISFKEIVKLLGKKRSLNLIDNVPYGFVQYNAVEALDVLITESERRFTQIELLKNANSSERPKMVLTTDEMVQLGVRNMQGRLNWAVSYLSEPVDFAERKNLSVAPYVLGAWLGDGYSADGRICGADKEVLHRILENNETLAHETEKDGFFRWSFTGLKSRLSEMGLLNSKQKGVSFKRIPNEYIYSSVQQRIELLSGLMDTDGTVNKHGAAEIAMTNQKIVEDMRNIVCSLGWAATPLTTKQGAYKNKDGETVKCKFVYSFSFRPDRQIFNIARKAEKWQHFQNKNLQQSVRHRRHYIEEIVEFEDTPEDYVCFEVDSPTHMFLCSESYIPTHNSTTLASIIREIQLNRSDKIITVEKPVEYVYGIAGRSSVTQREVGRDTKSFAAALDSAMRQHPDVLLIGEVRNQEEVSALLYAAETGHLAFSTMHTNSAPHTLNRIKRLFSGEEQVRILGDLSEVARGFSNQLLVKSLDGKSRSSVNEVLEVDDTVKNLILNGDVRGIVSYQEEQGITMEHELVKAVIEGRCSVEEARKVSSFRPRLDKLLEENDLV